MFSHSVYLSRFFVWVHNVLSRLTVGLVISSFINKLDRAGPHLYTNINEACGTEANPNKCPICKKWLVQCFPRQRTRQHSDLFFLSKEAKYTSSSVWLRTYFFFFWSTDSKQKAFGCSPNLRHIKECCSLRLGYMSTSTFLSFPHASFTFALHLHTDVDLA